MDEESYRNDLVRAQEDEEGFDLLNEETFGDLGGDDWENEHEFFRTTDFDASKRDDLNSPDSAEEAFDENDVENQLSKLVSEELDEDCRRNAFPKQYDMWADSLDFIKISHPAPTNGFREPSYVTSNDERPCFATRGVENDGPPFLRRPAMTLEELERVLLMEKDVVPSQSMQTFPTRLPMSTYPSNYQIPPFKQVQQGMPIHQHGPSAPRMAPMFPTNHPHLTMQHLQQLQMQHYNQHFNRHLNHGQPQQVPQPVLLPQQAAMLSQQAAMLPQRTPMLPQHAGMLPQQGTVLPTSHMYPPNPLPPPQGLLMASPQYQQSMLPQHPQQMIAQHHQQMIQHQRILLHKHFQEQQHLNQQSQQQQRFPLQQQQCFQQQQMLSMMVERGRDAYPAHLLPPQPARQQLERRPMTKREAEILEMREYDGLMDQKEKDWIIKIQFRQLHTDNPYVDDYYFTCWSMKKLMRDSMKKKRELKKMEKEKENGTVGDEEKVSNLNNDCDDEDDLPTLLVPQLAKSEGKRYAPVQYEGSLGRLTASSIHNPRQIIDVHLTSNAEDAKKQDSKKLRELLCKIEKSFDILLEADDLEKKALAQPDECRSKYYEDRNELVAKLCKRLLADSAIFLQQVVSIRKGLVLVVRLLPLVTEREVANEIVCRLLEKLAGISKKEWMDEVSLNLFYSLSQVILDCDFLTLVHLSEAVCRSPKGEGLISHMTQILLSQLGLSTVLLLTDRAELLLQAPANDNTVDQSNVLKWCNFVQSAARCLVSIKASSLRRPFKIAMNKNCKSRSPVGRHFLDSLRRFGSPGDCDGVVDAASGIMDVLLKLT